MKWRADNREMKEVFDKDVISMHLNKEEALLHSK